ncbi:hypothetical protein SS50377_23756 [Spironucleus salmonicida]|uniref:Uncharacterized protein n=1 Tax=Spironucleus salmonicida TaxID=348837 RepID=V6LPA1_9EUKA|nr:hypothetical protein SS50377_23756 [Spironucleus salmonicida]|eukprot:EST46435.1 Hypothetical protein SS50377_13520 [Spironucleus salmonicida]
MARFKKAPTKHAKADKKNKWTKEQWESYFDKEIAIREQLLEKAKKEKDVEKIAVFESKIVQLGEARIAKREYVAKNDELKTKDRV